MLPGPVAPTTPDKTSKEAWLGLCSLTGTIGLKPQCLFAEIIIDPSWPLTGHPLAVDGAANLSRLTSITPAVCERECAAYLCTYTGAPEEFRNVVRDWNIKAREPFLWHSPDFWGNLGLGAWIPKHATSREEAWVCRMRLGGEGLWWCCVVLKAGTYTR